MTATIHVVRAETGQPLSVRNTRRVAEAVAARLGGSVTSRELTEGERVSFAFHGHPRIGTVVCGRGAKVTVRFTQGGKQIEREIAVEKISV